MSRKWPPEVQHTKSQQAKRTSTTGVPRPFMPPSYYAAAGGIPYPTGRRGHHQHGLEAPSRNTSQAVNDLRSINSASSTRLLRRTGQAPPATSESESSFDLRLTEIPHKLHGDAKSSPLTRPAAVVATGPDALNSKRQGLPNVEAQLLPSLQSTIHRMTRPPSKILSDSTNGSTHFNTHHDNLKRKSTLSPPSHYMGLQQQQQQQQQHYQHHEPLAPPSPNTMNQQEGTPKSSRIPQKSALKSALRTTTTTASNRHQKSAVPESPQTPVVTSSPRRNSLRSVKSLLSRKLGNTPAPTTPTLGISSQSHKSNIPSPSVALSSRDAAANSHHTPTITTTTTATMAATQSHLPRPKFKLEHKSPIPHHSQPIAQHHPGMTPNTDESDVENKYQRQWMARRKLTVANAEVVPSCSSSDSVSLDSTYNGNNITPKPGVYSQWSDSALTPMHKQQKNLGLGFDIQPNPNHFPNSPLLPTTDSFGGGGERDRTKILRFSLPPSGSDTSLYSNHHHLSYPGSWHDSDYETERAEEVEDVEEEEEADQGITADRFSNGKRRVQAPVGNGNRDYWGDELSGSGSEEFESGERLDIRAARTYGDEHGWDDDGLRTPVGPAYHQNLGQQSMLPRPSPHRVAPLEYREHSEVGHRDYHRPPSSLRHSTVDPGPSQWTPKMQQHEPSNTWFNDSSRDYEDRFEHIPLTPHRRAPPIPVGFEASSFSLSQQSKRQAARERKAFGIPPSSSDEGVGENRISGGGAQRWSQDSYRSSAASTGWEWNEPTARQDVGEESLSLGAEAMLKSLHPEWARNVPSMSTASSAASFYDDQNDAFETATEDLSYDRRSSASTKKSSAHQQDRVRRESREDIILEFLHSEEIFLSNTQTCIDVFILPIRNQNSRSWIRGVPTSISRLLDWYEDISNLHLAIYQSLESSAAMQGGNNSGVASGLANYLSEFVGKLHVYQPYLVNLADVLEEVAGLVGGERGESDFGEFIRIQEGVVFENGGWSLERLLMEPVNRLAAYQGFFSWFSMGQNLLESTPQDHPEFLTTMMLSRSADTVMRVMTEVKVRETEHRLIQSLATQISDSAVSGILASRERRLLHSGTLRLVSPVLPSTSTGTTGQLSHHQVKAQKRSSKLVQAITHWDRKPDRSGSIKSTASSVATTASFGTMSSYGPPASLDSQAARMPLLRGLFKNKLASSTSSGLGVPLSTTKKKHGDMDLGLGFETLGVPHGHVQVFVFSDLVLMVLPKLSVDAKYSLVPRIGLVKVFSVGSESAGVDEVHVRFVPVSPDSIKNDVLPRFATITEAVFQVPSSSIAATEHQEEIFHPSSGAVTEPWLQALQKSSLDTLQLLSCPGSRKSVPSDRSKDTWRAVSSLVSSGLPMPKSPSGNLPDLTSGRGGGGYGSELGEGREQERKWEREERGWWELRYQQVLGELIHRVNDDD